MDKACSPHLRETSLVAAVTWGAANVLCLLDFWGQGHECSGLGLGPIKEELFPPKYKNDPLRSTLRIEQDAFQRTFQL